MNKFIGSLIGVGIFALGLAAVLGFAPNFRESLQGTYRPLTTERSIISATAVTATGTVANVKDFNLVGFTISNVAASGTVKFPCSMQETQPSFSALPSASNRYSYAAVVDLESGSTIAGNTGITFTNSTTVRHVAVRDSAFTYCSALFTQGTANVGSTTIHILPSSN